MTQPAPNETHPDDRPDPTPHDVLPHDQRRARRPQTDKKLRRSRSKRMIAGLFGGIAEFIDADPRLVRIIAVVATVLSLGIVVIGYLILWVLVPLEPDPSATPGSSESAPTERAS